MRITVLGTGTWGTAIAVLLSSNGHEVVVWGRNSSFVEELQKKRQHPKLPNFIIPSNIIYEPDLKKALEDTKMIVESVTSAGIRSVFRKILELQEIQCPIVITSKGIEQKTGLLFPEVIQEVIGREKAYLIGCISGPSHAEEVIKQLPTSIVGSAYNADTLKEICQVFNGPSFRLYPNLDMQGVAFGGAMKNIIAIACGISDGLKFGENAKAALMTRGLHEMRKLCLTKNANPETLNGLSGLGDLFVTCTSVLSRNYRFARLIAEGCSIQEAKTKIGMAVEGAYTCVSAWELGRKHGVDIPITDATYAVLYENMSPVSAVKLLLQRSIKKEHL